MGINSLLNYVEFWLNRNNAVLSCTKSWLNGNKSAQKFSGHLFQMSMGDSHDTNATSMPLNPSSLAMFKS